MRILKVAIISAILLSLFAGCRDEKPRRIINPTEQITSETISNVVNIPESKDNSDLSNEMLIGYTDGGNLTLGKTEEDTYLQDNNYILYADVDFGKNFKWVKTESSEDVHVTVYPNGTAYDTELKKKYKVIDNHFKKEDK